MTAIGTGQPHLTSGSGGASPPLHRAAVYRLGLCPALLVRAVLWVPPPCRSPDWSPSNAWGSCEEPRKSSAAWTKNSGVSAKTLCFDPSLPPLASATATATAADASYSNRHQAHVERAASKYYRTGTRALGLSLKSSGAIEEDFMVSCKTYALLYRLMLHSSCKMSY